MADLPITNLTSLQIANPQVTLNNTTGQGGFAVAQMTTAQMNALTTPNALTRPTAAFGNGAIVYKTDQPNPGLYTYELGAWVPVTGAAGGNISFLAGAADAQAGAIAPLAFIKSGAVVVFSNDTDGNLASGIVAAGQNANSTVLLKPVAIASIQNDLRFLKGDLQDEPATALGFSGTNVLNFGTGNLDADAGLITLNALQYITLNAVDTGGALLQNILLSDDQQSITPTSYNALVEIKSTTQVEGAAGALLLSRLDSKQYPNMASPIAGMIAYDSTNDNFVACTTNIESGDLVWENVVLSSIQEGGILFSNPGTATPGMGTVLTGSKEATEVMNIFLPSDNGQPGYVLQTDGNGGTSWVPVSSIAGNSVTQGSNILITPTGVSPNISFQINVNPTLNNLTSAGFGSGINAATIQASPSTLQQAASTFSLPYNTPTVGDILQTDSDNNPYWAAANSGSGNVNGPGTTPAVNSIATYSTATELLETPVTIDASGNLTSPGAVSAGTSITGTGSGNYALFVGKSAPFRVDGTGNLITAGAIYTGLETALTAPAGSINAIGPITSTGEMTSLAGLTSANYSWIGKSVGGSGDENIALGVGMSSTNPAAPTLTVDGVGNLTTIGVIYAAGLLSKQPDLVNGFGYVAYTVGDKMDVSTAAPSDGYTGNYSIVTKYGILVGATGSGTAGSSSEIDFVSSINIKKILAEGEVAENEALDLFKQIPFKKYEYKDKVRNGDKIIYGMIAEELREVMPHSVNTLKDFVPNIMQAAEAIDIYNTDSRFIYKLTFKDQSFILDEAIKVGDRIELVTDKEKVEGVIEAIDPEFISIELKSSLEGDIFVYGTYGDCPAISKNNVFELGLVVLQNALRRIEVLETEIAVLKSK